MYQVLSFKSRRHSGTPFMQRVYGHTCSHLKLSELRNSKQAVTYVKPQGRPYSNELQLSSLEVTEALTKIFVCSVDKNFLIR